MIFLKVSMRIKSTDKSCMRNIISSKYEMSNFKRNDCRVQAIESVPFFWLQIPLKKLCRGMGNLKRWKERTEVGKGNHTAVRSGRKCILMERDGRNLSMLREESIDCIITDHPWLDPVSNKGGNRCFADYECFQYTPEDFKEKARVLKQGSFLAEFLPAENENNYEQLFWIKQYAKENGLEYYCKVPWKKGSFVSNTGRKAKNTQDIMIFTKGKARNLRKDVKKTKITGRPCFMSGAAGMLPTMFDIEPVPRSQKIHQSELPISLCEELLQYLTTEGEIILDQFAGSGAVGVAALRRKRNCILIEKLHENVEKIKERFAAEDFENCRILLKESATEEEAEHG